MYRRSIIICILFAGIPAATYCSAARAEQPEEYELRFDPGDPESKVKPGFSPMGTKISLTATRVTDLEGCDHLEGSLRLGADRKTRDAGQRFVLARSAPRQPYDLLIVDSDRDGDLSDEEPLTSKPRENRGKYWSSFSVSVSVPHVQAEDIVARRSVSSSSEARVGASSWAPARRRLAPARSRRAASCVKLSTWGP